VSRKKDTIYEEKYHKLSGMPNIPSSDSLLRLKMAESKRTGLLKTRGLGHELVSCTCL
jgi:hypothetical protein